MQTFDSHLVKLYQAGRITAEEAIRNADSANNVRLKISLNQPLASKKASAKSTVLLQDQTNEKTESPQTAESPLDTMDLSLEPVADESEVAGEGH